MRITIAPKLFLGFVGVIFLNVFFLVIVSKMENVNSITKILKRQNEIKNHMLRLKTLHRVQGTSVFSFERVGRQESVDFFTDTQEKIADIVDTINQKIDSITHLDSLVLRNNRFPGKNQTLLPLKSSMEAIRLYNDLYDNMFDSIVQSKVLTVSDKKMKVWKDILDESDGKLSSVIDSAEIIIDKQTNLRIKDVELKVSNVKQMTIFIILGVTVFAMIFGLWFSTYITNALRRLTESAGNIGKGDFDVDPHGYPQDEIGDLASAFFQMSVDLKNAQEALVRSKRLAAIGEVVASVNHAINNPLMIISGNAQFLEMTMTDYPEKMRERVQTILEETERISQVTRKLREIKNPVVEDYTSSGEQMINLDKSSS